MKKSTKHLLMLGGGATLLYLFYQANNSSVNTQIPANSGSSGGTGTGYQGQGVGDPTSTGYVPIGG